MRIGLIIFRAERDRGGAERYTIDLAEELIDRGHEVSIVASCFEDSGRATKVHVPAIGLTRVARYKRFLANLRLKEFDIAHTMMPVPGADVYHAHAGIERLGAPKRFFERKRKLVLSIETTLLQNAHVIVLNRSHSAGIDDIVGAERLHFLRSTVRFTPVDEADVVDVRRSIHIRHAIDSTKPVALFVGNDFHRKGLDLAITAIAASPHWQLIVVGTGDSKIYSKQVASLKITDRVRFAGPTSNVAPYYAAADVLLLPARDEPFGMVVTEAMSSGVIPIVADNVGAAEVIRNGVSGTVLPRNTPDKWSDALHRLSTAQLREPFHRECLLTRHEFSHNAHVDEIESIYTRIVSQKRSLA